MSRFLDVSKAATLHRYALYGVGQNKRRQCQCQCQPWISIAHRRVNAFSSTVLLRNALDNYDDY